jgi:fluoride exporter
MENIVMIGIAGMAGTLARYWLSTAIDDRFGPAYPYGTVTVNLVGCFLIGFLFYAFAEQFLGHPAIRNAVFVGFLGGFTTFSSFGIQTFTLFESGQVLMAGANILISNVGGLVCVWAGSVVSRLA